MPNNFREIDLKKRSKSLAMKKKYKIFYRPGEIPKFTKLNLAGPKADVAAEEPLDSRVLNLI